MCNIMHVDLTDYQLTKEDKERIHLLSIVEKKGLKPLNLENLRLLERLVEKKDYGTSKKAQKAKIKLLNKINVAIYELSEGKPGLIRIKRWKICSSVEWFFLWCQKDAQWPTALSCNHLAGFLIYVINIWSLFSVHFYVDEIII